MRPELGYEAMRYLQNEVVFIHDEDRSIAFVSPSVEAVLGYTEEEFAKHLTHDLIHPDDLAASFETAVALRGEEGASYRSVLRLRHAKGHYLWCEVVGRNLLHTEVQGVVNTVRDVSEQRALEERLMQMALHDDLTGLPNRRSLLERLDETLEASDGQGLGVLIIDLDGFKAVNDRFGHLAGDDLLRRCAQDLARALRAGDVVARLGGDEFAVLCHRVVDSQELVLAAERIREAASGGEEREEEKGLVTASVGAVLGVAGDSATDLLRSADEALYAAKRSGRDRVVLAVR